MSETGDSSAPRAQYDREILRKALPLADFRYNQPYSELATSAEQGDSMAAYKLWLGLGACRGVPRDAPSLAREESRLLETRMIEGQPANDEWIANRIDFMKKVFPFCSSIPAGSDLRALTYRWLERAADAGSIAALLDFVSGAYLSANPVAPELLARRREMLDRVEAMALNGNPVALSRLHMVYLTDHDGLPRDRVKAHAFIQASREIMQAPKPPANTTANTQLSAGELAQAEKLKEEILRAAQTGFLAAPDSAH